jgi:hypothetical protein
MTNTDVFIVDASAQTCSSAPTNGDSCFFGVVTHFQQTCSPACYWGGLCNTNRCVKQMRDCIVFCPDGFTCSYGYCVANKIVPNFLQAITTYLYTTNALIQPTNPSTAPLYQGQVITNTSTAGSESGAAMENEAKGAAASTVALLVAAAATGLVLRG